ncbi:DUF1796 family putative cysteine peptidase [Sphingobacterium sp. NGMCC 1.201703]|uniref:DUF1796 family putative cysteine peptidase n=1 Tax=Sphingobacterium sp. NGMCC 1.201703 TaxID=3388657 RepID=UPI0039FBE607
MMEKVFISIGENCLADAILARFGLKSFTTPFSHGKSNIEYLLQLEKETYKDIVNTDYLEYGNLNNNPSGRKVPVLKKYVKTCNIYHEMFMEGVVFSHSDVIESSAIRDIIKKRAERLVDIKGKKEVYAFYHHRFTNHRSDFEMLIDDLDSFIQLYCTNEVSSKCILFTQYIIDNAQQRGVKYASHNHVHIFMFYTLQEWEGTDDDVFWAKCDEDLIAQMIAHVQNI